MDENGQCVPALDAAADTSTGADGETGTDAREDKSDEEAVSDAGVDAVPEAATEDASPEAGEDSPADASAESQAEGGEGGPDGCTGDCVTTMVGAGSSDPFDPATNDSKGVSVDPSGALVPGQSVNQQPRLIWIANSGENTVSKVDTETYQELGRYATGAGDPSRTSVDAVGDVYVGNRAGSSVTKISALGDQCPDTDADGVLRTSHGPGDVLPYGKDDCRLWETPLGHVIRGVVAQDIYTQVATDPNLPPEIKEEHYVWVGTLDQIVWKLDAKTGQVLLQTQSPCPVYGLALDGSNNLWMSSGGSCLGRIDTTQCKDSASCNALPICQSSCDNGGACTGACDTAGKEALTTPDSMYGITVDFKQRVWLGGGSGLKSYAFKEPAAARWRASKGEGFSHGVAADGKGFIWGANHPNVTRMNADTMEYTILPLQSSKGMAVDRQGKIWAISYMNTFATVIKPGPTLNDNVIVNNAVTGLGSPYTYSDMTGVQTELANSLPGHYRQRFEGCADAGKTTWFGLDWDATTPGASSVLFRARTADTAAAMDTAKWVTMAVIPSAASPVSLDTKFKAAGVMPGKYIDVEVWLSGVDAPKVTSFSVTHSCP